jgi:Zn-dependent protease
MGDQTARRQGRLSLNPIRHIDPFGSVLLPLMLVFSGGPIIGYAKPVPYNPGNFKDLRKGEFLVGMAGPFTNLLLAVVFALVSRLVMPMVMTGGDMAYWIWQVSAQVVIVNLCLMFFNLIPLPPLDGSAIIAPFLSDKALGKYYRIQRYSMPILLILLIAVPWILHVDPVGWYIENTAYRLGYWLLGI